MVLGSTNKHTFNTIRDLILCSSLAERSGLLNVNHVKVYMKQVKIKEVSKKAEVFILNQVMLSIVFCCDANRKAGIKRSNSRQWSKKAWRSSHKLQNYPETNLDIKTTVQMSKQTFLFLWRTYHVILICMVKHLNHLVPWVKRQRH